MAAFKITLLFFTSVSLYSKSHGYPCQYYSNGYNYDFSSLQSNDDYKVNVAGNTPLIYYVNICQKAVTLTCNGDAENTAVCQTWTGGHASCGTYDSGTWSGGGSPTANVTLTFSGGLQKRQSTIQFYCVAGGGVGSPYYTMENPQLTYDFAWGTQYACGSAGPAPPPPSGPPPPGEVKKLEAELSGGSVFLIILAVALVTYLGAGMVYNYRQSETGVRLVPQIDLWISIPGLVVDGLKYAVNSVVGRIKPGYSPL